MEHVQLMEIVQRQIMYVHQPNVHVVPLHLKKIVPQNVPQVRFICQFMLIVSCLIETCSWFILSFFLIKPNNFQC